MKRMIRLTFQHEGTEHHRDRIAMEHFYYTATHQALQAPTDQVKKATVLKHLKAMIISLHSQQQCVLLANGDSERIL